MSVDTDQQGMMTVSVDTDQQGTPTISVDRDREGMQTMSVDLQTDKICRLRQWTCRQTRYADYISEHG